MKNEIEIDEKAILIRINQLYSDSMSDLALYEATRGVWKVGDRKNKAELAFAVYGGQVKEIFKIGKWLKAGTQQYLTIPQEHKMIAGRWEFEGVVANEAIRQKYMGKSVKAYFPKGAANPVMYVNC